MPMCHTTSSYIIGARLMTISLDELDRVYLEWSNLESLDKSEGKKDERIYEERHIWFLKEIKYFGIKLLFL